MDKTSKVIVAICGIALLTVFVYIFLNPIPITLAITSEIRGNMPFGKWKIDDVKDYKLGNDTIRFSFLESPEKDGIVKDGIVVERINYHGKWNEYPQVGARFFFVFLPGGKTLLYEDNARPQLVHEKTPAEWHQKELSKEVINIGIGVLSKEPSFIFRPSLNPSPN